MSTTRTLLLALLTLGLTASAACKPKPPEGTTPPEDGATAAADPGDGDNKGNKGKKGKKGKKGDDGAAADAAEDPTKKACPAEVGGTPYALFADSALLRLPKGVEAMVEQNPFFATMNPRPVESVSCVKDVPGAMISNGFMGYFEDDPKKDMKTYARETLEAAGYGAGATISDEAESGGADRRVYTATVELPGDAQNPEPVKLMFVMKSAYGRMYYLIFETHPNAWNALKATFKESADSLLFLNP